MRFILNSGGHFLAPTLHELTEFSRMVLIPLSLFYSSLTKLFFLFLLSLWNPSKPLFDSRSSSLGNLTSLYSLFDDNHMDREWVVRNILGGISAGFGLRGTSCNTRCWIIFDKIYSDTKLASSPCQPDHCCRLGRKEWRFVRAPAIYAYARS